MSREYLAVFRSALETEIVSFSLEQVFLMRNCGHPDFAFLNSRLYYIIYIINNNLGQKKTSEWREI